MLRNLAHEIVRQRLWPVPAVAVLVAVAAPALFLKSAFTGAPAAQTAALTPAPAGRLPARAERLLAATAAEGSRGGATGSAHDPFQPPARHHATAHPAAATAHSKKASKSSSGGSASTASPTKPIPVVIQNGDGSTPTSAPTGASTPGAGTTTRTTTTAPSTSTPAVDVGFGGYADRHVHRSVPDLQPYFIHGKLAAVFVKYSSSTHKAVFAVAPGIVVSGPTKCRHEEGVCHYLDVPAGSYAQITMTVSGTTVRRRLDVVRIDSTPASVASTATSTKDGEVNACLLRKLQAQTLADTPVDRNACEGPR